LNYSDQPKVHMTRLLRLFSNLKESNVNESSFKFTDVLIFIITEKSQQKYHIREK